MSHVLPAGSWYRPPYRPLQYRVTGGVPAPVFPVLGATFWIASVPGTPQLYTSGDVVFDPTDTTFSTAYRCVASGEDLDGDSYLDTNEDLPNAMTGNGMVDYGSSGTTAPPWRPIG